MFWWNEAVEVIEATEAVEAVEVTEAADVLRPEKSLLRTSELKFIYSEKATKFREIFLLLLTVFTVVKSKGKISQNFVAIS